jgi:hypothetical protein
MILYLVGAAALIVLVVAVALAVLRARYDRELDRVWRGLQPEPAAETFDPASVAGLPEPARRYLLRAIAPGTPLARSVVIEMDGRIGLRPGADKLPFRSQLLVAPPGAFVWRATAGAGAMRLSGDDRYVAGRGAMRWFLWHIVPLVRAGGPDVTRSAAGRVALEAASFLPPSLLPQRGARWEPIDEHSARVHLTIGAEQLAPVLFVAPDGRLEALEMRRWDPEDPPGYVLWRGDHLSGERTFGGYRVATAGHVMKHVGTARAHSFFDFTVTDMRFQ